MEDERWTALVAEVAKLPGAVEAILAEHRQDDHGMCRAPECGRPGYGTPVTPWPCGVYVLGAHARRLTTK